mgnify:CR=1 FL=1
MMSFITKYFYGICLATIFLAAGAVNAKEKLKFIETTGRAVIDIDQKIDISRRRALEDALYLAALHGGAKINGFSMVKTDTSIEENLVVQPSSRILDYTILSEQKDETHYIIKLRVAVGTLNKKKCVGKGLKTISLFQPAIEIDPKTPFWVNDLTINIINNMIDTYSSRKNVVFHSYLNTYLDRDHLNSVNDQFDYISLTSGRKRTEHGDYSIVPSIKISKGLKLSGFTSYEYLSFYFQTDIYEGEKYSPAFSKSKTLEILFKSGGPWRTLNLFLASSNETIVDPMIKQVGEHVLEVISELGCKSVQSKMFLAEGKLEVPLGKKHGIKLSSLAVTKGERTPFSIFRVEKVLNAKTILTPLNDSLSLETLSGKTVEFIENM